MGKKVIAALSFMKLSPSFFAFMRSARTVRVIQLFGLFAVSWFSPQDALGAAPSVTFAVTSQSVDPGASVTVPVVVSSFVNVDTAQFTLTWDPTVLSYVSIGNFNPALHGLSGDFGTNDTLTGVGNLTVAWDESSGGVDTLTDGATMFTVTFTAIGAGGSTTAVSFAGTPTAKAVTVNSVDATFVSSNGSVSINSAPTISAQPQDVAVTAGDTALFSVTASGSGTLAYQWQFNNANIGGGTNSSYSLPNAQPANAGASAYRVLVSNSVGTTTSSAATLTVNVPVAITVPPQSQAVTVGGNVTLNVTASGTGPLTYQWQFNGSNIANATGAALGLTNVQSTAAGSYQVVVSNVVGPVTSQAATLTVNTPVSITTAPQNQTVTAGGAATFSVTAAGTAPLSYQWQFNGANITGATDPTLTLTGVATSAAGSYQVVVSNVVGPVTSSGATLTVNMPVAITVPPQSQAVTVGGNVTLGVTATGTGPLTYQWQLNGSNIANATGATLSLTNVQSTAAGSYQVVVSNVVGPVTSQAATLTVNTPVSITTAPQNQTVTAGGAATFSVTAAGTAPLSYQWQFNGANITGATDPTLTLTGVATSAAGSYQVVVSNVVGPVTSSVATLTVNVPVAITVPPQGQAVTVGGNVTLGVTATGTGPLTYQWLFNGSNIANATGPTLSLNNVQSSSAGTYQVVVNNVVGPLTSQAATLTVNTPVTITTAPQNQTVTAGGTATFSVTAGGTAPLSYQWQFNGANIPGATSATLNLPSVAASAAGSYQVVVSNLVGPVTSSAAALTVNLPVAISVSPQSQTVTVGANVTLSVTATGTGPLSYQWQFNGSNIPNAIAATLSLPTVQTVAAGSYQVVVSNVVGPVTSSAATLTVNAPVSITAAPQNQTVTAGSTVSFGVTAAGTAPLIYQWQFNGGNIPGATGPTLTLPNVAANAAGSYQVIVSNVVGPVTSSAATLTVNLPVSITAQPLSLNNFVGTTATFSVSASGTGPLSYQWQKNGANIPNAVGAILTLNNLQASDSGSYQVIVSNVVGPVTSATASLTVQLVVPPTITAQPQSATVTVGDTVTFSVTANGTSPSYQWLKDGSPLSGAVNSTFVITGVSVSDAGSYSVNVSNAAASISSAPATLTVNTPVNITAQPQPLVVVVGGTATFSVGATGSAPLTYQWQLNGVNLAGANSATLTINGAQPSNAGNYQALVTNPAGTVASASANLTVNVPVSISVQPASQTVIAGAAATMSVSASGTAPLAYLWQLNGVNLVGATNATFTVNNAQPVNAGAYQVVISNPAGSVTSSAAILTVNVPLSISAQPSNQSATLGGNATFSVTVSGGAPITYQWQFNGNNIPSATGPSLAINNARTADAGAYQVVITNPAGSLTSSSANLTVNVPVTITSPPKDVTVNPGSTATFAVTATGTGPLSFQWLKNGAPIAGATGATLSLNNAQQGDAGSYSVVVSNVVGAVTSATAALTVNSPPAVSQGPKDQSVTAGSSATFSVIATGTAPLSYQWQHAGVNVPDATSSSLTINNAKATDAGGYSVVVSNIAGTVTSASASLVVNFPVIISGQPTNQVVNAGTSATFSVSADGTGPLSFQWFFNGNPLPGATSAALTLNNVGAANAGAYFVSVSNLVGVVTSASASLSLNAPPAITSISPDLTVTAGNPILLAVTATGAAPLSYLWLVNGSAIPGATNSTISFDHAQAANAGSYQVTVSNVAGAVLSGPIKLAVNVPPTITLQPTSQTNVIGDNVSFLVIATGAAPLGYQWFLNQTPIGGATGPQLALAKVQTNQAGQYTVTITNIAGSVTSDIANLVVNVPVAITAQPTNQVATAGAPVSFTVGANGTGPLGYQWLYNGNLLPGANAATYAIASAKSSDAGSYSVVVSNLVGAAVSSAAALSVVTPPSITKQPTSKSAIVGASSLTFSVATAGTEPIAYQWQFNGAAVAGATNSTLTLSNIVATMAGAYAVTATNAAGSVSSSPATLTINAPPAITLEPQNVSTNQGARATFTVAATGTGPLGYQWLFNGNPVSGATNATVTFGTAQPTNAGLYSVIVTNVAGSIVSDSAQLAVNVPPTIARQPSDVAAIAGANALFSVVANGTDPLSYQWQRNGAAVGGATNSTLSLASAQTGQVGAYTVVVVNPAGSVTSAPANLTLTSPVQITTQPAAQVLAAGANATFAVGATGSAPLGYQWRFFGVNLPGATNSALTVIGVQPTDAGPYSVVVTNSVGSTNSVAVQLTVNVPPVISVSPLSQTNAVGDNVNFTVSAKGTAPLGYQWRLNGANLTTGTNDTLTLSNVQLGQAGSYVVVVSNAGGAVTSAPLAVLTVNVPPSIQTQPASQNVAAGANATFTVAATGTAPLSYQWRRNGAIVSGQTNSSLTLNGVQAGNLGDYSVLVINSVGTLVSSNATLGLNLPALTLADNIAASATSVATTGSFDGGSNANATKETGEPNHAGKAGGHSVWFAWQAPATGIMTINTAGSSFDTALAVYTGPADVKSLVAVTGDDDSGGQVTSQVQFNAVAGTLYRVAIDGASASSVGHVVVTFSLNQTAQILPQILSNPADQTAQTGGSATFVVFAAPAGVTYQWFYNGAPLSGQTASNLVLAAVQIANAGPYTVRVTSGANFVDSVPANLQINDSNDTGSSEDKFSDLAGLTGPSGLSLASFPARVTPIQLEASGPGVASAYSGVQVFTTFNGTPEPGEPNPWRVSGGAPEWFLYQAKTNGVLRFDTTGSDFKTLLAVFTGPGTDFASLVLQGADAHSSADGKGSIVTLAAVAGTTYFVVVDGENGAKGHVTLNYNLARPAAISRQPAGGAFLSGTNVTLSVTATNVAAPAPLSYQWSRNGLELASATNTTLTIANVQVGSGGNYTVAVANFAGVVTSQVAVVSVGVPLTITSQPKSQSSALGSAVTLSVAASGTDPLAYQWNLGGAPLNGATNASLTLANIQGANAGSYTVVITNVAGSVTSAAALLSVSAPPAITTQPASRSLVIGGSVTFSVTASSSSPLTYQWRLNGANLAGATNSTLPLNNVQASAAGIYTVVVGNSVASVLSSPASLGVSGAITISSPPQDQTANAGDTIAFNVVALGTAPLSYQWQFDGTNLAGAQSVSLILTNVQAANAGQYRVVVTNGAGSVTSPAATLAVNTPIIITQQPQSQTLVVGANLSFSVTAAGDNLSYQWRYNGADIAGAIGPTLTLSNVQASAVGTYAVLVSNGAGGVISAPAQLTASAAPTIVVQPQSQVTGGGGAVTFSVTAFGSAPLSYQWRFNGVDLPGATNSTYKVSNAQPANAGAYQVAVKNSVGTTLSAIANLAVNVSVTIVQQPASQPLNPGATVTFHVVAVGSGLSYQWLFNSVALIGATNDTLTLTNVSVAQAGVYNVIVSSSAGAATSADAFLSQAVAPTILVQPQGGSASVGGTIEFDVQAVGASPLSYQWVRNSVNIPGATDSSLTLTNLQLADHGKYQVAVSNSAGTALSDEATLLVVAPPVVRLAAGKVLANGAFSLTITGPIGQGVQLQASSSLANWAALTNLTLATGTAVYSDTQTAGLPQRFYRLSVLP